MSQINICTLQAFYKVAFLVAKIKNHALSARNYSQGLVWYLYLLWDISFSRIFNADRHMQCRDKLILYMSQKGAHRFGWHKNKNGKLGFDLHKRQITRHK